MKTVGIIAEYNPFHNGHKYHIEESKRTTGAEAVIVIMSGNFVQRGEPALINKWKRAQCALSNGADLVIELPTYYALSSAEMFAYGGVSLLNSLGIDTLVFGSEHGEIQPFYKLAELLVTLENKHISALQQLMKDGHSFATARSLLIKKLFDLSKEEEALLNSPNNILGVEYLKAILKLNSPMKATTIKRKGSHYHSSNIDETMASASAIRKFLFEETAHGTHLSLNSLRHLERQVSGETLEQIKTSDFVSSETLFHLLRYKLMTSTPESLQKIHDVSEGLEYKILRTFGSTSSFNDLITHCKSKRYTYTRLSRALMKILLEIHTEDIGYIKDDQRPEYARILGFTETGAAFLKTRRDSESIQMITNLKHFTPPSENSRKMMATDLLATNIYSEFDSSIRFGEDHYRQPCFLKTSMK